MLTLKNILTINALSSGATGLLLMLFNNTFSRWFELKQDLLFTGVGLFLLAFAGFVLFVSRWPKHETLVWVVITMDIFWVVVSFLVVLVDHSLISQLGIFIILAVALWVVLMAYLQHRGLKKLAATLLMFVLVASSAGAQSKLSGTPADSPPDRLNSESIVTVTAFIDAVQNDHKKIAALLDSSLQWHQPGNNQLAGVRRNIKEVYELFSGFNRLSAGTLQLAGWKILAVNGNQVVCHMHWKAAQPTGRVLDVDNVDVYTVHSGKITHVMVYTADPAQEDLFWMN